MYPCRTETCCPPRLCPCPSPGGLPIGPPRWRLAHGLGLCCCFYSVAGRRLVAHLACASAHRSVVCPQPATSVASHWLWLCCSCLCRPGFAFSGTTVMDVRLPGPATAARAEPSRISGLEIPALNNTMILTGSGPAGRCQGRPRRLLRRMRRRRSRRRRCRGRHRLARGSCAQRVWRGLRRRRRRGWRAGAG